MACKTFHRGKYFVTFRRGFDDCKRDITLIIDKVFENDTLKISLSDDDDPSFLCILSVSRLDYEDLKKQQGLLIDFDNFPSQLVRLLQQCASNNMFLIMHQTNPVQFYFEIVEHNEFKRLVHLSLKTGPATDSDIKMHMANTITTLKKMLTSLKSTSSNTEAILNDKCINMERKIHDLSLALNKMEDDKLRRETEFMQSLQQEKEKLAQERLQWQKNMEMNLQSQQATSQDNMNKKDKQIEELNCICKQLKEKIKQLDSQLGEKCQRLNVLETEVQKTHIEVATLQAKKASLDREILDKEKLYNQLNARCVHLEKTLKDNAETIKELNNTLHTIKKEKNNIEEKLMLSESLAVKNNEAAQSTAEQLLKANQIISKQNSDLLEMKEKLLCRTAIALEQEKVIEKNTAEIEELHSEISSAKQNMEKLICELENLKEKCDNCDKALKDRDETIKNNNLVIQWLHKKMESGMSSEHSVKNNVNGATSSTPYFLSKNNTNSTEGVSEDSINFYATSKLSNVLEDSIQPIPAKSTKSGLDPKYLKPASSDQVRATKADKDARLAAETQRPKGKENKTMDLPKVEYKEKKSSRGTTYRATPVSAYFP